MGRMYMEIGEGKGMGVVRWSCSNDAVMSPSRNFNLLASCGIRPMIVALAG
jgi:hypothetical protein